MARPAKAKAFRPVHPNAGIAAAYRKKLLGLIEDMNASVQYWLKAEYRGNRPAIAQDDALPASALRSAIKRLSLRWQKQFDDAAPKLADYFAAAVSNRSDRALQAILRDAGFSVKFKMTREMRDVMQATINEQVSLIKSIPSQYFTQIEGMVMRSVQTGRDLGALSKDLQEQFGVTRRRAANIARSQNNIATSSMTRARQDALGITEGDWVHSGAGKHKRPTHVAMSGKRFDLKKGMYDPAVKRWILPGTEPNCRCIWRPVIAGFS